MGGGEPCWFLIVSCGLLGLVKSVVKENMHFCDWNRREPNIPRKVGTLGFVFFVFGFCFPIYKQM
jgi:hypothetical protein